MRKRPRGIRIPNIRELEENTILFVDSFSSGLYSSTPPSKVPQGGVIADFSAIFSRNFIIRDYKTRKAPGNVDYSITKPNSNRILYLDNYKDSTSTVRLVRHTASTIHYASASSWNNVTTTPALTGTDTDPIRAIQVDYRYLFTNNGRDPIQEIDFSANTCAPLSATAPRAKRIFGFNNRIVGINIKAGAAPYTVNDPALVVWSGNDNYDEFDYAVDTSAGFKRLVESPADSSDFLIDGMGFANVGLIIRQKSIWTIAPGPTAADALLFECSIPNVGCSSDYGTTRIENGVVFIDERTKGVYILTIDENIANRQSFKLDEISGPVKRDLFKEVAKVGPDNVFVSYDPTEKVISIHCLETVGVFTADIKFSFNLIEKAWSYRAHPEVCFVSGGMSITSGATINELVGTINDLSGVIDDLSSSNETGIFVLYGTINGDILVESDLENKEHNYGGGRSNLTCELLTKVIDIPKDNIDITCIHLGIIPRTSGTVSIDYSFDGGRTFYNTAKSFTISNSDVGIRKLLTWRKVIHCESIVFRISSGTCIFEIVDFEILGTVGGDET